MMSLQTFANPRTSARFSAVGLLVSSAAAAALTVASVSLVFTLIRTPIAHTPGVTGAHGASRPLLERRSVSAGAGWSATRSQTAASDLTQAKAAFDALVAETRAKDDLPHLADPKAAQILNSIWAAASPESEASGTVGEVAISSKVSTAQLQVLDTYLYFPAPAGKSLTTDQTTERFGPEISRSLAASIAAAGHMAEVLEALRAGRADSDPTRNAEKIRMLRAPGLAVVINSQKFMAADTAKPEDIARVAAAYKEEGSAFTLLFSDAQRTMIEASFRPLVDKIDGSARHDLEHFLAVLVDKSCGHLCAVAP